MLALSRNEAIPYEVMKLAMKWDWETFPQYLDSLDRLPKGINLLTHVPLSPVYARVMGYDEAKVRRPTTAELQRMCQLVDEGIEAGACGWSTQIMGANSFQRDYDGTPLITDLMTQEEAFTFAKVVANRDIGHISLIYDTGRDGRGMGAEGWGFDFPEQVAELANRPVLYQSLIPDPNNAEQHRKRLRWLEGCGARRVPVYGLGATQENVSTMTFEDWNLFDNSPAWRAVTMGTPAERKAKMETPSLRDAIRAEYDAGIMPGVGDRLIDDFVVHEVVRPEFEKYLGLRVAQIAEDEGKHVVDVLLDITIGDDLKTEFSRPLRTSPEYATEINQSPYVVAGASDGGAHVKFLSLAGYTTGLLTWLVRDEGRMTLEEMHFKLSYLPAFVSGIRDRGLLREGAAADVVVYDLDKLTWAPLHRVYDLPGGDWRRVRGAEGYRWTIVNGEVTHEEGQSTGALSGKLLRPGVG